MSDATEPDTLEATLRRFEIELPSEQVTLLERYCRALWEWNEKLNLTRHTDYENSSAAMWLTVWRWPS